MIGFKEANSVVGSLNSMYIGLSDKGYYLPAEN